MRALTLTAVLVLAGCSSSENVARLSDSRYAPLADDVAVEVTTGDLDGPYEELAIVAVRPGPSWFGRSDAQEIAVMNERLRREARRIGAVAVVRVSYDVSEEHVRATGTAVRLR